jgi:hypothetical protein
MLIGGPNRLWAILLFSVPVVFYIGSLRVDSIKSARRQFPAVADSERRVQLKRDVSRRGPVQLDKPRLGRSWRLPAGAFVHSEAVARILYHVLSTKEPYAETVFHRCDEQAQRRAEMRLRKQAAQLGSASNSCPSRQPTNDK